MIGTETQTFPGIKAALKILKLVMLQQVLSNMKEFMWVGERPLDLTEQEEKDFKELIIYGFNKLNHGSDEGESDY